MHKGKGGRSFRRTNGPKVFHVYYRMMIHQENVRFVAFISIALLIFVVLFSAFPQKRSLDKNKQSLVFAKSTYGKSEIFQYSPERNTASGILFFDHGTGQIAPLFKKYNESSFTIYRFRDNETNKVFSLKGKPIGSAFLPETYDVSFSEKGEIGVWTDQELLNGEVRKTEIVIFDISSKEETRILSPINPNIYFVTLGFSNDLSEVFLRPQVDSEGCQTGLFVLNRKTKEIKEIEVVRRQGLCVSSVDAHSKLAVAVEGLKLPYIESSEADRMFLVDLRNDEVRELQLRHSRLASARILFSPDAANIAYYAENEGTWLIDVQGKKERQIGVGRPMAWSDDFQIAIQRDPSADFMGYSIQSYNLLSDNLVTVQENDSPIRLEVIGWLR